MRFIRGVGFIAFAAVAGIMAQLLSKEFSALQLQLDAQQSLLQRVCAALARMFFLVGVLFLLHDLYSYLKHRQDS